MTTYKLAWNNLKNARCPKCAARLIEKEKGFECMNTEKETCEFFITNTRLDEILGDMYSPRVLSYR